MASTPLKKTIQQEYQCHSSLSDILKTNVFTRGRWSRTTTTTALVVTSCVCLLSLTHWLTSSTVDQTEYKGQQAILDLEWHRRNSTAGKKVALRLFLKALEESGICGLCQMSCVNHCDCASSCTPPEDTFTASVDGRESTDVHHAWDKILLAKVQGSQQDRKDKVQGTDFKNKDTIKTPTKLHNAQMFLFAEDH